MSVTAVDVASSGGSHQIMYYKLRVHAAGAYPELDIDETTYREICEAKEVLYAAMAVEEKYELLLSNYLELEKESLSVAADDMLYGFKDYSGFFDVRLTFNQRVVNLLTSTRLYVDQIKQHVKACLPDDLEAERTVKQYFSNEYDQQFEYRFMEALRNYVQHRGLAVHSTSHSSRRTSSGSDGLMEFGIKLFSHRSEFENDSTFKRPVLREMPDKVDLIGAARKYVESISDCHIQIRDLISDSVAGARAIISGAISKYSAVNNGDCIGLAAQKYQESKPIERLVETVPILLDWDDVRLKLVSKNKRLTNLSKRCVTSNCL
ncbi:hypothetical protein [Bacterioplanoides sp. SCSIO 12839]|uniref:hypothetical protein n=1 Tax=Bacterioplanoides sp. SCSIO 12839 TaxID=2829569 RepID=UPI002106ABB1|nr:hypothetical protein [Bacterioplanoides sp. SCSIO 12839]UTW49610.1 hypothetical protein KFF03_06905 [Bacterioplanoides sp. SCSIO 12839]